MSAMKFEGRRDAVQAGTRTVVGEQRKQAFSSQMRAAETVRDDKTFITLDGYASTVGVPYVMYDFFGEYTEQIAASAFDVTLSKSPDVAFLLNHTGMTMARTTAGTLELAVDEVGLRAIAQLNPLRQDVKDLKHAIDDGNIDQMSFAFRIVNGRWSEDFTQYTITEVDLDRGDVSAVNYGANPDTSISARTKQALEGIEHLSGEPLRIAAARAAAKLAEARGNDPEPVDNAPAGPNAATLRAIIDAED
jgi:HK97 family phage prohead protease